MKRLVKKPLGQLLKDRGLLKQEDLEKALAHQRKKGGLLGKIMVEMNLIDESIITEALMIQYGYPYMHIKNYSCDKEIVKLLPQEISREYCAIVIDRIEQVFILCICDPLNQEAIDTIKDRLKGKIRIFVSTMSEINQAIDKIYKE
ncbi:MAG: hypothetical protein PHQ52_00875 [Candidatus Omnitrophica bacterium]|nr:hypothetical protein [Candidatus Omnitrophota bacterium]